MTNTPPAFGPPRGSNENAGRISSRWDTCSQPAGGRTRSVGLPRGWAVVTPSTAPTPRTRHQRRADIVCSSPGRSCTVQTILPGDPLRARLAGIHPTQARAQLVRYNLLILGASYGSLFSTKVLMAGHRVALVCTRPTAELINREGTLVRFPVKGGGALLDIS